jgi:phage-related protein
MFKALGIGLGVAGIGYAILNPNIILSTVLTAAQSVVLGTLSGMTTIMTAAQWALNVAMDANPVGLLIIGIAALAAGVYYAYEKSETFRAVLSGIGDVAEDLEPIFKGLGETILGALTMNPALIVAGFKDAYDGITKVIGEGGISAAFNKGYDSSILASHKADAAEKQKEADAKKTGTATDHVHRS